MISSLTTSARTLTTAPRSLSRRPLIRVSHAKGATYTLPFPLTSSIGFRIDGVTPECMDLAAMFTSSGSLYPCGSACLQYNNLDSEDVTNLQNTIQSLLN